MKPTSPTSISALERQLREGSRLRFAPALEPLFLAEHADAIVPRRLALLVAALVLIGITPLLNAFLLHPPPAFDRPALLAQFGVMIPALLVAMATTLTRRLRRWQDPVAAVVAFTVTGGILFQRHVGAALGFHVPIELVSVVLLGTAVLGGLRVVYFAPLVVAIVVAFSLNELGTFGVNPAALNTIVALTMMAVLAAIGAYMEERNARGAWLHRKLLEELAVHDALSGLANARAFRQTWPALRAAAARDARDLLVAIVDIDYFKNYNDHYGHPAGDACIRHVAEVLQRHGRHPGDIQARIGGEEFALVWYDIGAGDARALLEALRADVENLRIPHAAAPSGPSVVTISVGAAHVRPGAAPGAEATLQAADQQLYRSKQQGRNRVSLAD